MSYDLFFCRKERIPLDFTEVVLWSKKHPNFKATFSTQLWYENEQTGVYFSIDRDEEPDPEGTCIPDGYFDLSLSFNLNFLRPQVFALEAMPMIESLQHDLQILAVDDKLKKVRFLT